MGSIPWVVMQLLLVAILIFWPGLVTMWLDKPIEVDLDSIRIDLPTEDYEAPSNPYGPSQ